MEARPDMTVSEEEQQISELVVRLTDKFPHLTPRCVREEIHRIHRDFADHRVREFIPLLVERIAERQLSRRVSYRSISGRPLSDFSSTSRCGTREPGRDRQHT
ncbi:three-helix bundle dimerization domain-containing protein [Nocardia sp. NPDC059240]|uniref:three-helix bundle dimerization domain-containing protein n=1 Tax=Nocardia sp. NPDC059240 TaxID=3346786 RepID=UPI00367628B6